MKIIGSLLALCAVLLSGPATAQVSQDSGCVPYTIPIESTVTACDNGMLGSKYKTATKVCPSGEIKQSVDYVTTGCYLAPAQPGRVNTVNPCIVTPDACAPLPLAQSCPAGQKWSLAGTNIAHCVLEDPVCGWGQSLTHDYLGNPSCVQNTCPSNQVLQSDGVSCACPVNTTWNGSSCVAAPTCTPRDDYISTFACPAGYSGTRDQYQSIVCPDGPYGASAPGPYWNDESRCQQNVTCTASTTTEWANCSTGTGQQSRVVTTSCPSGSYGAPSTSAGAWDQSGCVVEPTCTQTSSTVTSACGTGYTGNKYVTTTNLCPSGTSTSTNTSECGCSNGGTDYPTCTEPAPTCTPSETTVTRACGTGYTGNKYVTTTKVCPSGTTSTSTDTSECGCSNGGDNYPTCTEPAPTCTPSTTSTSLACGTGYTGQKTKTTEVTCPGSISSTWYDTSSCGCANGGTDYPTCTEPCSDYYTSTPEACGTGYTGTKYRIDYYSCPKPYTKSTWYNEDPCRCANGASDYPTCTPPPPPPPPAEPTCMDEEREDPNVCPTSASGTTKKIFMKVYNVCKLNGSVVSTTYVGSYYYALLYCDADGNITDKVYP